MELKFDLIRHTLHDVQVWDEFRINELDREEKEYLLSFQISGSPKSLRIDIWVAGEDNEMLFYMISFAAKSIEG